MKTDKMRTVLVLAVLLAASLRLACGLGDEDPKPSDVKLVINELLAKGIGDAPDWVELKNIGSTDVDLTGFALGDSSDLWTFPKGTKITAGGYLVVIADDPTETPADKSLHASFKLSASGEKVKLLDASKRLVDEVTFGEQEEGVSYGRMPDGGSEWQALNTPTPGEPNRAGGTTNPDAGVPVDLARTEQGLPTSMLVINELLAKASAGSDWLELFNRSGETADIGGFTLDDGTDTWTVPAGTTIPAGGYLLVMADKPDAPPNDGKLHANFKLGSSGETLTMKDATNTVIDTVTFGLQQEDVSWGRLPNGIGDWQAMAPTPGAANKGSGGDPDQGTIQDAGVPDGPAMDMPVPDQAADTSPSKVVVINELLAKAADGGSDWIELRNLSSQTVDLSNYVLGDGVDVWTFPASTTIAANGYLLVYADDPTSPPGDGKLHANFKLSASGETLTLKDAAGQAVDTVVFGVQQAGISWGRLPDGSDTWQAMTPTPGAANGGLVPDSGTVTPDAGVPDTTPPCSVDLATATSNIVINEVLADDGSGAADWVELKNKGGVCFNLSGYLLSDDKNDLSKWAFPAGTEIAAGGYVVVLADDPITPPQDGKLHATFKLKNDEDVVLSGPLGHKIDMVTIPGKLDTDEAYARIPDGTGAPKKTLKPTAGAANEE